MEIPNSMAAPADGAYGGECLEELRRGVRSVLWLTVREGRKFILKGLPEGLRMHPEEAMRLRKEYSLGLRVNHPWIAGIYGFETHPVAGPVIVMEFVDGTTLCEWLNGSKRQPLKSRLTIARQIADALAYMHSLGVSHRDLKPDNILITRRGDAKIIDIGLGDSEDSVVYKQSLGTYAFGAPEQQKPTVADSRADVFSFGKILESLLPERKFRKLREGCLREDPDGRLSMQEAAEKLEAAINPKKRSVWRWILIFYGIIIALGLVFGIAEELYTGAWRSDYSSQVNEQLDSNSTEDIVVPTEMTLEHEKDVGTTEMEAVALPRTPTAGSPVASGKTEVQEISKAAADSVSDYEAIYAKYMAEMNDCIRKLGSACDADGMYIESILYSRANRSADIAGRMVNELSAVNCPYPEMCRLSDLFFNNTKEAMEKIDGRKME